MKNVLFLVILMFSLSVKAQCRIGYSFDEISTEFKSSNKLEITKLGNKNTLLVHLQESKAYYVFNDSSKCFCTVVKPLNIKKLNSLIESYSTDFVEIGEFQWIGNIGEGKILFEVKYFSDMGLCIVMSLYEKKIING